MGNCRRQSGWHHRQALRRYFICRKIDIVVLDQIQNPVGIIPFLGTTTMPSRMK